MEKQTNLCTKHGITQDELNDIIHEVLAHVPALAIEPKKTEVLFDLLRIGDIVDEDDQMMCRILRRAALVMSAQQKCEDCLLNGYCYNQDRKDKKTAECAGCLASLMFFAQLVPVGEPTGSKDVNLAFYKQFVDVFKDEKAQHPEDFEFTEVAE